VSSEFIRHLVTDLIEEAKEFAVAKTKKSGKAKSSVKVNDMKAKKNPKGGAYDAFVKIDTPVASSPTISSINFDVSSLNFKK